MSVEIVARHYRSGEPWLITARDGAVERLERVDGAVPETIIAPALCDIQVNGFAGIDFNAPDLQPAGLAAATRALAGTGVMHYFPTIVTGAHDRMRRSAEAIVAAARRYPAVAAAVRGIHVEGPHISPREGARGAHDPRWIRPPDEAEFAALQEAAAGTIRLVTLAPEWEGATAFISRRVAEGIVVALGHTTADMAAIMAAVAAGARLSTHLGNGSEALLPRHENYVTIQLGNDDLAASFIPDGHHLPPYLLKSFIRAKGVDRSILTTDCMAAAGAPPGRYRIGDLEVEVGADRVVRNPGQPGFAGSALTLDRGVDNTARWAGLALSDAIDMASLHPLRLFAPDTPFVPFVPRVEGSFIIARDSPAFQVVAAARAGRLEVGGGR